MGEIAIPAPNLLLCSHFDVHVTAGPLHWAVCELKGTKYQVGMCRDCATAGAAGIRLNSEGTPVLVLAE